MRNLGVWFDSDFAFPCHVKKTSKACFVHTMDVKRFMGYLIGDAVRKALHWLPIEHPAGFKTVILVNKILQCGYTQIL